MSAESIGEKEVLAFLKAKRASLDQAIAALEGNSAAGVYENGGSHREVQADSFVGMNIATGSIAYLKMVGRPARSTEEIHRALSNGGLPHVSRASVATILLRINNHNGDIARVSKGQWGLAEWYPNRPKMEKRVAVENPKQGATRPIKSNESQRIPSDESRPSIGRFLTVVQEAGKDGISTESLAAELGYKNGRPLPFMMGNVNKRLRSKSFEPKDVYDGHRIGKVQTWFAGEKIEEALEAIRS